MNRLILLLGAVAGLSAAAPSLALPVQPPEERARQQPLPKSDDPVWRTLERTRVTADIQHGVYLADSSAEVKALSGRPLTVTGFMLQIDLFPHFNHFLLARRTPVCAFCPPGAPNEVVEVNTRLPVRYQEGPVTVSGQFTLQENGQAGLFFRLDRAEVTS